MAKKKQNVYVILDPANHDATYSELAGVELWSSTKEIENGVFDIEESAKRINLAELLEKVPEFAEILAQAKSGQPKDFDQETINRAGRLLLGWSGLHPRREKEIAQFLDAVDKSTAPEACADVTFAITGGD